MDTLFALVSVLDISHRHLASTTRTVLVSGATVRALVKLSEAAPSPKYKIFALARDASNLAKPDTLFNEPIHAGLSRDGPNPNKEQEARALVEERRVQHVVYTSVD
ncbi:hypothetical protein BDZ89DRAFT_1128144 [Hymenopellis radicata]|nr:hypothetical protein BDZ89DRAFT_1128144 [Hymenopellis radicata]